MSEARLRARLERANRTIRQQQSEIDTLKAALDIFVKREMEDADDEAEEDEEGDEDASQDEEDGEDEDGEDEEGEDEEVRAGEAASDDGPSADIRADALWDESDKVYRCILCTCEVADGHCHGCGQPYDIPKAENDEEDFHRSVTTDHHAIHPDRCLAPRGTTPPMTETIRDMVDIPPEYVHQSEYRNLLRRGATKEMCARYELRFRRDVGIIASADDPLYAEWAGALMKDTDVWKICLGRQLRLDPKDVDGTQFINDLLEEVVLFPFRIFLPNHSSGDWETVEEHPGVWVTRPTPRAALACLTAAIRDENPDFLNSEDDTSDVSYHDALGLDGDDEAVADDTEQRYDHLLDLSGDERNFFSAHKALVTEDRYASTNSELDDPSGDEAADGTAMDVDAEAEDDESSEGLDVPLGISIQGNVPDAAWSSDETSEEDEEADGSGAATHADGEPSSVAKGKRKADAAPEPAAEDAAPRTKKAKIEVLPADADDGADEEDDEEEEEEDQLADDGDEDEGDEDQEDDEDDEDVDEEDSLSEDSDFDELGVLSGDEDVIGPDRAAAARRTAAAAATQPVAPPSPPPHAPDDARPPSLSPNPAPARAPVAAAAPAPVAPARAPTQAPAPLASAAARPAPATPAMPPPPPPLAVPPSPTVDQGDRSSATPASNFPKGLSQRLAKMDVEAARSRGSPLKPPTPRFARTATPQAGPSRLVAEASSQPTVEPSTPATPKSETPVPTQSAASPAAKKSKPKKDPKAPKGARTAYLFFQSDARTQLKSEQPAASNPEILKQISARWKSIGAEEKEKYEKRAEEDTRRHAKEYHEYQKTRSSS